MFVHLHTHTEYSLLDGMNKIKNYVKKVKEMGQTAAAITDHGNMYGAVEFYKECKKNDIKPIIGCEVYVAPGSCRDKGESVNNKKDKTDAEKNKVRYYHLILLAMNETGYNNLMKIVSLASEEGFYYKPRTDKETLRKYNEGLICCSACLAGELASVAANSGYEAAKKVALEYIDIFGKDRYFMEIQDHMDGSYAQGVANQIVVQLSQELGVDIVATNDAHYTDAEDAKAHEILLCMQTKTTLDDPNHMVYEGGQYYVKSEEEMRSLFPYCQEAIDNTQKVADMCNFEFEFGNYKIPKYEIPAEFSSTKEYLTYLAEEGFKKKFAGSGEYSEAELAEIHNDLEYELGIIDKMGFVEYILIVWDYINWAMTHGCLCGPGRGSAAGSRVCYSIGITNIDPVRYGLLFERFLNPERVSMPDIDVDFEFTERQRVIDDYIKERYGKDNVSQITTFQTMMVKNVIKDSGKVLGIPFSETNTVTKYIPGNDPSIKTLDDALAVSPELKEIAESNKEWFGYARKLEGLPKATSLHAAGVVIYPERADECMPQTMTTDGIIACQYNMVQLEELGYLKMDFLGLKALGVEKDCIRSIKENHGVDVDLDKIPLNDPKVLDYIGTGKTVGVFQLESSGMQKFMKELKPHSFEDVIAGISLYRPGPMDFIPAYIKGKNDQENIQYSCPHLEPILKATYGCIVYQEQVMQIFRELAGYTMGQSDNVRRAMSKKKQKVIDEERSSFVYGDKERGIKGCIANDIAEDVANAIYDSMVNFAKYAFNKSHAAAYAVISMQTAWMKCYYPVEYMSAMLSSVVDKTEKLKFYLNACKAEGIKLLTPDINKSRCNFVAENGSIRFGFSGIKGLSQTAGSLIEEMRNKNGQFTNYTDILERFSNEGIKSPAVIGLAQTGAFDSLGIKRRQVAESAKDAMEKISKSKKYNCSGQMSIFDMMGSAGTTIEKIDLPDVSEYSTEEKLEMEYDAAGLYISGHPLDEWAKYISKNTTNVLADFHKDEDDAKPLDFLEGQVVKVAGYITQSKVIRTKKTGEQMAFFTIEDLTGKVECVCFPKGYEIYRPSICDKNKVIVQGAISLNENDEISIIVNRMDDLNQVPKTVWIRVQEMTPEITEVLEKIQEEPGNDLGLVYIESTKEKVSMGNCINAKTDIPVLEQLVGHDNVKITA